MFLPYLRAILHLSVSLSLTRLEWTAGTDHMTKESSCRRKDFQKCFMIPINSALLRQSSTIYQDPPVAIKTSLSRFTINFTCHTEWLHHFSQRLVDLGTVCRSTVPKKWRLEIWRWAKAEWKLRKEISKFYGYFLKFYRWQLTKKLKSLIRKKIKFCWDHILLPSKKDHDENFLAHVVLLKHIYKYIYT